MDNKKYYVRTKIRTLKRVHTGKWTNYTSAVSPEEMQILRAACRYGLAQKGNDASKGQKNGEYIEVVKYFTANSVLRRLESEKAEAERALGKVLKSETLEDFEVLSTLGGIVVNGVAYANFYGDGDNKVEVCKCDFAEFKESEFITRRQVYNPNEPITIVKFDEPKTIEVKLCDSDDNFGIRQIENACGFCIWERKLKIFVTK